jgi:hypothetical protein
MKLTPNKGSGEYEIKIFEKEVDTRTQFIGITSLYEAS